MLSQANPVARPLSLITAITKIHSESTLSHGHLTAKCYCNPSRVPQILNGWSVNWQHRNLKNISFHVSKSMGSQESSSWGLEAQKSSKAKKDMAKQQHEFQNTAACVGGRLGYKVQPFTDASIEHAEVSLAWLEMGPVLIVGSFS